MRVALRHMKFTPERLRLTKQLGVNDVILGRPMPPGGKHWEFLDLLQLRAMCNDMGINLEGIEGLPGQLYDKIVLGLPGRDEQIEELQITIRNMGKAGIPILAYDWIPGGAIWRTSKTTLDRGGATVTSFDMELVRNAPFTHEREYSEEEIWANFIYFLKAILPVAEEAGVVLALHPNDPPVESLGGIPCIFRSSDAFKRAMEVIPSPSSKIDFCQGCWSSMGEDVSAAIKYFGGRDKIALVHFRDVKGVVPKFRECFINKGNTNMWEAMRAYHEINYRGIMIPDHVPHVEGDDDWGERARAHAIGYMQALIDVVKHFSES